MGSFRGYSEGRLRVLQVLVAVLNEFWGMKVLVRCFSRSNDSRGSV